MIPTEKILKDIGEKRDIYNDVVRQAIDKQIKGEMTEKEVEDVEYVERMKFEKFLEPYQPIVDLMNDLWEA